MRVPCSEDLGVADSLSALSDVDLFVINKISLECAAFEVKHLQQLVTRLNFDTVFLKAEVDPFETGHLDSVEAVDA